jgi:hypothetical protein
MAVFLSASLCPLSFLASSPALEAHKVEQIWPKDLERSSSATSCLVTLDNDRIQRSADKQSYFFFTCCERVRCMCAVRV